MGWGGVCVWRGGDVMGEVREMGQRLGIKGRTQSDSARNRDRKKRRQRKMY